MQMAEGTPKARALKRFMESRGLNTYRWSESAGVDEGALRKYLAGKTRTMKHETLEKLASAAQASVAEILGDPIRETRSRDIVPIRRLSVRAAMGGGVEVSDEGDLEPIYFRRDWVAKILEKMPGELRAIDLTGDSMEPTLTDGDVGLVSVTRNVEAPRFESGKIYVLWDGNGLVAKRLIAIIGKPDMVRVVSDNPRYQPDELHASEPSPIIGRLVWRGGAV